jgi:hypothetical protein
VLGGIGYSQSAGSCTWPQGGRLAVVKLFGDADEDGIANDADDCRLAPNSTQVDTDLDGYGNACDADYDGDGRVGLPDFLELGRAFGATSGSATYSAALDADSDGVIGMAEFLLFGASFGKPPGPSALACAGIVPCL